MRIAHTADWHLDRTTQDQTSLALSSLVRQILDASPDLCLVPGDLFVKRGYLEPQAVYLIKNAVLALAEKMPVLLIPGNHDLTHSYDKVDALAAIFSREGESIHRNVRVFSFPCVFDFAKDASEHSALRNLQVAAIPSPSKYVLLSQDETATAKNVQQVVSARLMDILHGLVAQLSPDSLKVLMYHGTIAGGVADNERMMDTEEEIVLPRHTLVDGFDIVACGHLHRPQEVGNAVYSGAIAPLRFDAVGIEPSWVLWEIDRKREAHFERIPIPVAHQLISITIDQKDFDCPDSDEFDPTQKVLGRIAQLDLIDAKVRLRYRMQKSVIGMLDQKAIERALESAFSHKIEVDAIESSVVRVEGLERGMDLAEMFDLYAGVEKEAAPFLDELKELGKRVDARMTPEQRLLLKGIRYKPLAMWWENWKPLGKGSVRWDELGRLVCIDGDNTLGKSNLVEIEPFVLWGPRKGLLRGEPLRKCIRDGCQDCRLGMEIEADSKVYKVERTVGLTKESASSTLAVSERVDGDWKPVNLTQKELEEVVGSRDLFLATRFARQGDIDRLLDMRPAALKETLQDAFNVGVFEIRKDIAGNMLRELSGEIEKDEAKQKGFESDAARLSDLDEEREKANAEKEPLESRIKTTEERLEELKAQLASQEAKAQRVKDMERRVGDLENRCNQNAGKLKKALSEKTGLQESVGQRDEIAGKVLEINVLRQRKDEEWEKIQKAQAVRAKISKQRQELKDLEQVNQRKLENLSMRKIGLEEAIEDLETHTSVLDEVKEFGCERTDCPAIALAVKARGDAEKKRVEHANLEREKTTLESQEVGVDVKASIKALEEDEKKVGADEDVWKKIHRELEMLVSQNWETKAKEIAVAETKLEEIEKRITELKNQEETLRSEHEKAEEELKEASREISPEAITRLTGDVSVRERELSGRRRELSELDRRLGQLDGDVKRAKDAADRLKELKRQLADSRKQKSILEVFVKAMGRDGIPFLFMEAQLPRWTQHANEFLSVEGATEDWTLSVKVDPIRDLVKGTPKNEVVVWFTDEKGTHPLQSASGFQRNALGSALRAALAKLMAELTGSTICVFVHDEAWSAFRDSRMFLAQHMVRRYAEAFEKVVFVTHQPEMRVVADSAITLSGDPVNGTQVAVER